ncbi:nuclear inhibitor of phosphatase 1 [Olea europaea subsp. europaea]|uniref:Nuclear inhibitor of phosphatase 1 n=1 Tax=Olea europaea subsp. europaea TaxID=158383 RepID=A0A8S0Q7W2_OLEEU|nr:nuclear inhibitor of phosphatase 1 [Olea europaea subsp. europaea]
MYGRSGLDRFKKAETLEPFSVNTNSATKSTTSASTNAALRSTAPINHPQTSYPQTNYLNQHNVLQKTGGPDMASAAVPTQHMTQFGGGQSTWQPPDWAIEPRPGVYYLEVLKDGEVLDRINLDKRRHIFGRQLPTCDFVLDHQSVSRQHAAVVPHKDGSIYVIDLGSAHGTFVANERLTKDSPIELEVGQSLRFAASTRTYILRKNNAALFPPPPKPAEIELPSPPDPSDEEAVLAYNTYVNRSLNGLTRPDILSKSTGSSSSSGGKDDSRLNERAPKRIRRTRVAFRDQVGGELVQIVGISDGADVETEPGPMGVKEGSLVGKYESLVQITVIPKGTEQTSSVKEVSVSQIGVTEKLQQALNKVKTPSKSGGMYDDLYGESFSGKVGSSWALSTAGSGGGQASPSKHAEGNAPSSVSKNPKVNPGDNDDDNDDDLFG